MAASSTSDASASPRSHEGKPRSRQSRVRFLPRFFLRWLALDPATHTLGEELVVVETVVRPLRQKRPEIGLVHGKLECSHHVNGRFVLHLDELLLGTSHLLRPLDEPGFDVDDLHHERESRVHLREARRDHLRNTQQLGDLDLPEPTLLTQEIDLLFGEHQQARLVAEDRVQAVACEVAHPCRHFTTGTDGHQAQDERLARRRYERRETESSSDSCDDRRKAMPSRRVGRAHVVPVDARPGRARRSGRIRFDPEVLAFEDRPRADHRVQGIEHVGRPHADVDHAPGKAAPRCQDIDPEGVGVGERRREGLLACRAA